MPTKNIKKHGENKTDRKIAVIVATDAVGYSTSMEENEVQTLINLKTCRSIISKYIKLHQGRIFNTAGDAILAEFPSAVEAVICAAEFQEAIMQRNNTVPQDQQMRFRVGINMGDVVIEGNNLYGDGVNVASRLEALAEAGGICLSKNVHDVVHRKMSLKFHDLGKQKVKNTIVEAVDVLTEGMSHREAPSITGKFLLWHKVLAVVIALFILIGIAFGIWWSKKPEFKPADINKFAYNLPKKPSIAVLPFKNLSGDKKQDYLGDGLAENIISVFSTSPNLFVISRNSSFIYKGKNVKVQNIAEGLGVRYVLEGGVQRFGDKLRVSVRLIDALNGDLIWTKRYDRKYKDLFAVQDEITKNVFNAMQIKLTIGSSARLWQADFKNPEVWQMVLQGRASFYTWSLEGHKNASRLWRKAIKLEPSAAITLSALAWLHYQKIMLGISKNPKEDMALATKYAQKSLAIREDGNPLGLLGVLAVRNKDYEQAIKYARRIAEISSGDGLLVAGSNLSASGKPLEGIELLKRAMRSSPYYPSLWSDVLAYAYLMSGQLDKAHDIYIVLAYSKDKKITVSSRRTAIRGLVVISVFKGQQKLAEKYYNKLIEIAPQYNLLRVKRSIGNNKDQVFVKRYLDALKKVGLPEK